MKLKKEAVIHGRKRDWHINARQAFVGCIAGEIIVATLW